MHSVHRTVFLGIALIVLLPPVALAVAGQVSKRTACCFTNPGYAGVCRVEPGKEETCEKILAYLNNPASAGKTYCRSTEIRRGWNHVACDRKSQRPAKTRQTGRLSRSETSSNSERAGRDPREVEKR